LDAAVNSIERSANPQTEADRLFNNARGAVWFRPVIDALRDMAGVGERCMFCSGSESSCVEHFRPKAIFPPQAMAWLNMLWSCDICNRSKGTRFPPHTYPGEPLVDPTVDNVWAFFFIDEYGNLTARWRPETDDLDGRALNTISIFSLDRDALQYTRQARLKDLKIQVLDALRLNALGQLTQEQLRERIEEWKQQPFQPDVADYFLNGPGQGEEPFVRLFAVATS
jgi:uncharacterized protein (TIGR02646 family)